MGSVISPITTHHFLNQRMTKREILKHLEDFSDDSQIMIFNELWEGVGEGGEPLTTKPGIIVFDRNELFYIGAAEIVSTTYEEI